MAALYPRVLLTRGSTKHVHKARALLTTLLSTTAVAAAQNFKTWEYSEGRPAPPGATCCYPATYTSMASHWTRQSCLASDLLELHHTAKYTGRPVPSRPFSSGYSSGSSDDEEEPSCLQWYDIDTEEFVDLVDKAKMQLFDVREPEELEETGIIPGAVNLPLGEVEEALTLSPGAFEAKYGARQPSKDDTNIVFHCRAGVRSLSALESAHQLGYSRAKHYVRGFLGWADHLEKQNLS